MGWIMILVIWLVAPFAEFGIIIGLLVSNDRYKKQIQELKRKRQNSRAFMGSWGNSLQQNPWENLQQNSGETPVSPSETRWQTDTQQANMQRTDAESWAQTEEWHPVKSMEEEQLEQFQSPEEQPVKEEEEKEEEEQEPAAKEYSPQKIFQASLGTLALVLGVILIVLAGLIFATTTWHILPDICKAFLVLACAAVFFGASFMAAGVFHIRKTGNAFYILGSIFLFLSVLAAAYFKLLGAKFILVGENRWKVLWVGSIVTLGAFWAGLKRFDDKIYTQTCLWGMTLSLFFMAKGFSVGWNGFVCIMMVYSLLLIIARESLGMSAGQTESEKDFPGLLAEGFRSFAPIHFWTFCTITMLRGLFAIWRMAAEGCIGTSDVFLDRFSLFSFTGFGMGAMGAAMAGICVLMENEHKEAYRNLHMLAASETILYAAGWVTADFIYRMAAVNLAFLLVLGIRCWKREKYLENHSLFLDICGCLAVLFTIISFYSSGRVDGLVLCMAAFAGYYLWFYFGNRQWPHLLASIGILPLPFMAKIRLGLNFDQLSVWVAAALLTSGILARHFYPVVKQDDRVQGQWRMDWYHIVSIWVILFMAVLGNDKQQFVYILLAGLYFLQYREIEVLRRPALSLAACCALAAFWRQPFIIWPEVLKLEMGLLPAVLFMWTAGLIWNESSWIPRAQNAGYAVCLILLCADAVFSQLVADALLLEGICLAIFVWAQVKNSVWWVRISAAVILAVALFMTRSFWLSISWWVYLLTAGIGLIIFAGIMEKKRR